MSQKESVHDSIIVDCDAEPNIVDYDMLISIQKHIKHGQFTLTHDNMRLYFDKTQQSSNGMVGNKLQEKLLGLPVLNANVLDALLAHPEFIPREWEEYENVFWGTIYYDRKCNLSVCCLVIGRDKKWKRYYKPLHWRFSAKCSAVLSANPLF